LVREFPNPGRQLVPLGVLLGDVGDLLLELLLSLVGDAIGEAIIPEWLRDRFIAVFMTIAGVTFIAFSCLMAYGAVKGHEAPLRAGIGIATLVPLSGYCFKLASKGFRT
jgi:hypothetical protein